MLALAGDLFGQQQGLQMVQSIPGQPTGSREQAIEPLQRPQPAILVAPQPPSSGTMSVALPDAQQLYADLKRELQNIIVRLTALENQVESLMRTMPKQQQLRILTPQEMKESRGALLQQHIPQK